MNHRHQETLKHVFKQPVDRGLDWWKIEHLFSALGAKMIESGTSRIKVIIGDNEKTFSRPHHRHETNVKMVKEVRKFLEQCNITPETQKNSHQNHSPK